MKLPIVIALALLLPGSYFFKNLMSNNFSVKSKTLFNSELQLRCSPDQWNSFTDCPKNQLFTRSKRELIIPVVGSDSNPEQYELILSHHLYVTRVEESLRLGEGRFKLIDSDSDYICGTYEGFIDQTNNRDDLLLFLNISGGTGQYAGLSGYLSITCIPNPADPSSRSLTLKGIAKQDDGIQGNALACR